MKCLFYLYIGILSLLLLPSCLVEDDIPCAIPLEGSSEKVRFSVVTTKTEVRNSQFLDGDAVGIFALLRDVSGNGSTEYATNKKWLFDSATSTLVPATENDEINYPAVGVLDYYCYFPYQQSVNPLAVPLRNGTDFIVSVHKDGYSGEVPLFFTHKMAHLSVTLDNPLKKNVPNVTVHIPRNGTYNLFSDEFWFNTASNEHFKLTRQKEDFFTGYVFPTTSSALYVT